MSYAIFAESLNFSTWCNHPAGTCTSWPWCWYTVWPQAHPMSGFLPKNARSLATSAWLRKVSLVSEPSWMHLSKPSGLRLKSLLTNLLALTMHRGVDEHPSGQGCSLFHLNHNNIHLFVIAVTDCTSQQMQYKMKLRHLLPNDDGKVFRIRPIYMRSCPCACSSNQAQCGPVHVNKACSVLTPPLRFCSLLLQ